MTPEVSPFLHPEAMAIASRYFYPYYFVWKCYPLFAVVNDDEGRPVAACALMKYFNGNVQLFGAPNGFNESGFVYESAEILPECLALLKKTFGEVEFLKIDERSPLASHRVVEKSSDASNVAIHFGESFEEYFKTLSSSVRQNIRTAYNRLGKDGLSYNLQVSIGGGKALPIKEIMELYCRRHSERYGVATSSSKKWFLKNQNFATRFYRFSPNALTFYLTIEGRPAAFMSGLWSGNRLIIPRLSINNDFRRYSPGLILICESIKYLIGQTKIRVLDLSKGEETYKFQMGGEIHKSYSWQL